MEICEKCNGTGFTALGPSFTNAGELPGESKICDQCEGKGNAPSKFFVEIIFKSKLLDNIYWLPLFIMAEKGDEANKILALTLHGLEKDYEIIHQSNPLPKINLTRPHIESSFNMHRMQKVCFLNARVWKLVDIEPNLELSFDENIKFVIENMPLIPRTIAACIEQRKFPVRLIREGTYKFDFNEFLIIDVIRD